MAVQKRAPMRTAEQPAVSAPAPRKPWPALCKVVGPGSIWKDGRELLPGDLVELGERDVIRLGTEVEVV